MSDWLTPSKENAERVALRMRRLREPARLLLRPLVTVSGTDPLPSTGPGLLISNHVTMMDPVLVGLATQRAVHWMATETLFGPGMLGAAHKHLGALPKTRFRADMRAIRLLRGWLDAGAIVGIFPEGERTWTGELGPIQRGLGRLIRMLKVPVYTAQLDNAYRLWPRWSARPRRGTVAVNISGPHTFTRADKPADIEAMLSAAISVPFAGRDDLPMRGRNLATGLTNLVYACPDCGVEESLDEEGSALTCRACGAEWTVDVASNLVSPDGTTTPLQGVLDTLRQRTIADWKNGVDGAILTSPQTSLGLPGAEPIGTGRLRLLPDRLELVGEDGLSWQAPLAEIDNINIEFQRVLELRVRETVLRASLPTGSAWRWPWSVQWWTSR